MRCTHRIHQNNVRLKFPLRSALLAAPPLRQAPVLTAAVLDFTRLSARFHTVCCAVAGGKCVGNTRGGGGGGGQAMFIMPIVAELFIVHGPKPGALNATHTEAARPVCCCCTRVIKAEEEKCVKTEAQACVRV